MRMSVSWPCGILTIILLTLAPATTSAIEFVFDWGSGFTGEENELKRDALEYAGSLWESWIANTGDGEANTIEVDVWFDDFSDSLGITRSLAIWDGHVDGYTVTSAQYMIATGSDLTGTDASINFGTNHSWYFETDGHASEGEYDFVTVALHEIGHLLGFAATYMPGPSIQDAVWGYQDGSDGPRELSKWDSCLREGGNPPTPGSSAQFDVTGSVTFAGPEAEALNGGEPVQIYAPGRFDWGSSLSHVDTVPSPLMTYALSDGPGQRGLYDYEVGMFRDIGWTIPLPSNVQSSDIYDGDWQNGNTWNGGLPPASDATVLIDSSTADYTLFVMKHASANSVRISGTATLQLRGGTLTVAGDIQNDGTFNLKAGVGVTNGMSVTSSGTVNIDGGVLQVTNSLLSSGTVNIDGGQLTANSLSMQDGGTCELSGDGQLVVGGIEEVGRSGTGSFRQTGGTHTVARSLELGRYASSSGTYELSGESQISADYEAIGLEGTGMFRQSGGRNTVNGIGVARLSGSRGTYELSENGLIFANGETIGHQGTGKFIQTGGANTIAGSLSLGAGGASVGTYELSGDGQLTAEDFEYVGEAGSGNFRQTGGTNAAGVDLFLGYHAGSNGTYELSGHGQVSAEYEDIGFEGTGLFRQTGGTNTVDVLRLGHSEGSEGTYELSGDGQLTAIRETVGSHGTGRFFQTGGANTVGGLTIGLFAGITGAYELSGDGELTAVISEAGIYGTGTFRQTGGTHTVAADLALGRYEGSNGTYELSGGELSANVESIGHDEGTGTFLQSGGTNAIAEHLRLGNAPGSYGAYEISGGTLNVQNGSIEIGSVRGVGEFSLSGGEVIADEVSVGPYGTFSLTSSGTLRVNRLNGLEADGSLGGRLEIGHSGGRQMGGHSLGNGQSLTVDQLIIATDAPAAFAQSGGTVRAREGLHIGELEQSDGTYELTGNAQLSSEREVIGYKGTGTFIQSGGTNSIAGALFVGGEASSHGTYELSGEGQLSTETEEIGSMGSGTFTQSGGTHAIAGTLHLGRYSSSNGNYELNGSGQVSANREIVGVEGTGTFTQRDGMHTIANDLSLGDKADSRGTYWLNGGQLSAHSEYIGFIGTGEITQSSGTNTLGHRIDVGSRPGSHGTYRLRGDGRISAYKEIIGREGNGEFIQEGGTNDISNVLWLGSEHGGYGVYLLNGNGQLSSFIETIGYEGTGMFIQSGGVNTVEMILNIKATVGAEGTYKLSGDGRLNVGYDMNIGGGIGEGGGENKFVAVGSDIAVEIGNRLQLNSGWIGWGADANGVSALSVGSAVDVSDGLLLLSLTDGDLLGVPTSRIAAPHDLLLIDNQGANPVFGLLTFDDTTGGLQVLNEGDILIDPAGVLGNESYRITYQGGDGNDIYLKIVSQILFADVNLDGVVNGLDVDPFVDALLIGPYQAEADMNEDLVVNGLDVDLFVAAVVGGGSQQIPEPSTLVLAALGLIGLLAHARQRNAA